MSIYNEIRPALNTMKRFLPILFAASVAYAAGSPRLFVMTDTNGVLALPTTFISSNAAAIAAALPAGSLGTNQLNAQTYGLLTELSSVRIDSDFTSSEPVEVWTHPNGIGEESGEVNYGATVMLGMGYANQITTNTTFDTIRCTLKYSGTNDVLMRIWIRDTWTVGATQLALDSVTPMHSQTIQASAIPSVVDSALYLLDTPLSIAAGKYLVVLFYSSTANQFTIPRWTTTNINRVTFAYVSTSDTNAIKSGISGYGSAGIALLTSATNTASSAVVWPEVSNSPRLIAPKVVSAVVGDTLQIFKRPLVEDPWPYNLGFQWSSLKGYGYPRYWSFLPTTNDAGYHALAINRLNRAGTVMDRRDITVRVKNPTSGPSTNKYILCVGDSLTQGGEWVIEAARRLTGSGGTPAGLGYTNITFIGNRGTAPVQWQGTGGWAWSTYIDGNSQFFLGGTLNFTAWCATNSFPGIDYCYVLLGWNSVIVNYRDASDYSEMIADARYFLTTLKAQYPNVVARIISPQLPSLNGGLAANHGATGNYSSEWPLISGVNGMRLAYDALVSEPAFSGWVEHIDLASQFDSENNMPEASVVVNTRSAKTEMRGTNGVHPATEGYMQIADAIFRDMVWTFCQ